MENAKISDNSNKSKIESSESTYLNLKDKNINSDSIRINEEDNRNNNLNNTQTGFLTKKTTYYLYTKLGNTYALFGDKYGSPLIVIGPQWYMYFCCCSIINIIFLLFFKKFWIYMNIFFQSIGIIIFLAFCISYSYTSLVNPGIPKYDENAILGKPRENYRFCRPCGIWTSLEENTSHCFDCDICYEGFDHHCPWTGKCIAKKNTYSFYIFIVTILCAFCYFVTALTHAQHNIFQKNKTDK